MMYSKIVLSFRETVPLNWPLMKPIKNKFSKSWGQTHKKSNVHKTLKDIYIAKSQDTTDATP
jgi:hypothetical protein